VKETRKELSTLDLPKEEIRSLKYNYTVELNKIKDDVLSSQFGNYTSNSYYHSFITEIKMKFLPNFIDTSVPYHLKSNPWTHLPGLLNLHKALNGKYNYISIFFLAEKSEIISFIVIKT